MAIVFVDESGDTGFKFDRNSSKYLVACLVGFESDTEYQKSCSEMTNLRVRQRRHENYEFKYSGLNRRYRTEALTAAAAGSFWFYAFALNKPQLWNGALRQKNQMYQKVVGWLFENSIQHVAGSEINMDRCGNRDFYKAIREHLHETCKAAGHPAPSKFAALQSHDSLGLQIADLVAGSVARLYSGKPNANEHYMLIADRCRSLRCWP